jgi:hypothetical protein
MGKQVRFYMTHTDELDFISAMNRAHPTLLWFITYRSERRREIKTLQPVNCVADDTNLALVVSADPHIRRVPTTGATFQIEPEYSEIIQFNRSRFVDDWLDDGRLWFSEYAGTRQKSDEFIRAANSAVRWIRRHYERGGTFRYYVGPDAWKQARARKLHLGPDLKALAARPITLQQMSFYMTHTDELDFIKQASRARPVHLLRVAASRRTRKPIASLRPVGSTARDQNLVIQVSAAPDIRYLRENGSTVAIDSRDSEVVQLDRCYYLNSGHLCGGRLWFEENLAKQRKSAEFIRRAASLAQWLRNHYKRSWFGDYIGPDAWKQYKAGKLKFGGPVERSPRRALK